MQKRKNTSVYKNKTKKIIDHFIKVIIKRPFAPTQCINTEKLKSPYNNYKNSPYFISCLDKKDKRKLVDGYW